jgi:outer membrane protein assembly factor BamB
MSTSPLSPLLSLVVLLSPALALAADWPQWRGPERDGVSKETGLLKKWPAGGPPLEWSLADIGAGYTAPAVAGGKLFITGADAKADRLYCLTAATGNRVWEIELGPRFTNGWGDGPRATPTVDAAAGKVYAVGGAGRLVCADIADGKVLWQTELKKELRGELASAWSDWGYSEGVLIDGDRLVASVGGSEGAVVAFDKATGKVIWRSKDFPRPVGYCSIMPVEAGGVRQYVAVGAKGEVAGLAAADGRLLWEHQNPRCRGIFVYCTTPVVKGDSVYVTCGYRIGCDLLKITADGKAFKAEPAYANTDMINHHGGVVLVDGKLFGYCDGRGWTCQDFATGKVLWRERDAAGKGAIAAADGRLYLVPERGGDVVLIEATGEGWRECGRFRLPTLSKNRSPSGGIWTHPVIADGRLYLRDQEHLFCFDVREKSAAK